ncbi:DUF6017 domain-containing protein [Enterocloster sp.]|uniref:DUF6017 domain-containing protein n=1 Tax=Enterocloster sp. TaxID=2719315 RepID=UPI003890F976
MSKLEYFYGTEAVQFSFFRIPRVLVKGEEFRNLSNNVKQLYGLMLDRTALSQANGWLDEENKAFIYYKYEDIMVDLNCAKGTCAKCVKELEKAGLIETKRQGQGKPNIIYVKRIVTEEKIDKEQENEKKEDTGNIASEVQKLDFTTTEGTVSRDLVIEADSQKSNMQTSKSSENELPEVQNLDASYTKNNYNNHNYTNLIYPSILPTTEENNKLQQVIRQNIDYDAWMARASYTDRGTLECLYQIICDVVCIPRPTIRIGQTTYPYQVVREKFLQICNDHIEYVLECLKKTTAEIRNIWSYLLQVLYRSTITIDGYYQQAVRHDWYGTPYIEEEEKNV